jgi:hypothetical protein
MLMNHISGFLTSHTTELAEAAGTFNSESVPDPPPLEAKPRLSLKSPFSERLVERKNLIQEKLDWKSTFPPRNFENLRKQQRLGPKDVAKALEKIDKLFAGQRV